MHVMQQVVKVEKPYLDRRAVMSTKPHTLPLPWG